MRIGLAFKAFFAAFGGGEKATAIEQVLQSGQIPAIAQTGDQKDGQSKAETKKEPKLAAAPKPARSEAISLLAALQRDARFLDLVMESLDGYEDAQIGAAARDVLSGSRNVLERVFAPQPQTTAAEGEPTEVPTGYDPAETKLVGNVSGNPPYQGTVVHPGWKATKCNLPAWQGSEDAALVIAPAEIEVT
jgi:CheY-like chemotaxis protein